MKEFFARLNPTERRFIVGVIVVFFIVINLVFVWPHFGDWSETKGRNFEAQKQLGIFANGTNQIPDLTKEIDKFHQVGEVVPPSDQAVRFVRVIQSEASKVGIIPDSMGSQRQTGGTNNPFFLEQNETMTMQSTESQLVDLLYNLGSGTSLIRVKVLSVQPDQSHQRLTTRVTLIASYQKPEAAPRGAAPAAAAPAPAKAVTPTPAPTPAPVTVVKPQAAPPLPITPARTVGTNRFAAPPPGSVSPGTAPKNLTPIKK